MNGPYFSKPVFRYYIVTENDEILGTDDEATARMFAASCADIVVDTQSATWLDETFDETKIKEAKSNEPT